MINATDFKNVTGTLDREDAKTDINETALIRGGIREALNSDIARFKEDNEERYRRYKIERLAMQARDNDAKMRHAYAQIIIRYFQRIFNVEQQQIKAMAERLKEEEILVLEDMIFERIKNRIKFMRVVLFGVPAIVFTAGAIASYYSGSWLPVIAGLFLGPILMVPISEEKSLAIDSERKMMKKKFGDNYFPVAELKQILGLK